MATISHRSGGGVSRDGRQNFLRFAKVAAHTATIVDVPSGRGEGVEYDVWEPDQQWPASLEWIDGDSFLLIVGPYRLTAYRTDLPQRVFRGIEHGPYGDHQFDVIALSTATDSADTFLGRSHLMFTSGSFTPTSYSFPHPNSGPGRSNGASVLHVPKRVRVGDRRSALLSADGIYGGVNTTIRVTQLPSKSTNLKFDIDVVESFRGSFNWSDRDEMKYDLMLPGLRSQTRVLLAMLME